MHCVKALLILTVVGYSVQGNVNGLDGRRRLKDKTTRSNLEVVLLDLVTEKCDVKKNNYCGNVAIEGYRDSAYKPHFNTSEEIAASRTKPPYVYPKAPRGGNRG